MPKKQRKTPEIPAWIREFRHDDYTNIYELLPSERKLYHTETLFGDWNAQTLLLSKDAAPADVFRQRIKRDGPDDSWRHGIRGRDSMGYRVNEKVVCFAKRLKSTQLYGPALAHMLKNDLRASGRLPDFYKRGGPLHKHLQHVLEFVILHMPNLRAIVCFGKEARWLVSSCPGGDKAMSLRVGSCAKGDLFHRRPGLLIAHLRHPARPGRGGWSARREEWAAVARRINRYMK